MGCPRRPSGPGILVRSLTSGTAAPLFAAATAARPTTAASTPAAVTTAALTTTAGGRTATPLFAAASTAASGRRRGTATATITTALTGRWSRATARRATAAYSGCAIASARTLTTIAATAGSWARTGSTLFGSTLLGTARPGRRRRTFFTPGAPRLRSTPFASIGTRRCAVACATLLTGLAVATLARRWRCRTLTTPARGTASLTLASAARSAATAAPVRCRRTLVPLRRPGLGAITTAASRRRPPIVGLTRRPVRPVTFTPARPRGIVAAARTATGPVLTIAIAPRTRPIRRPAAIAIALPISRVPALSVRRRTRLLLRGPRRPVTEAARFVA